MTHQGKPASTIDKASGCVEGIVNGCQAGLWNLFFLAGIVGFVYMAVRDYRLTYAGETAVGLVIALDEASSPQGGCCVYAPVVQFTVGEQTYTVESKTSSYPPKYEIGEEVDIRYDPHNPQRADVTGNVYWWFWATGAVALLITLIVLDILGLRNLRRGQFWN